MPTYLLVSNRSDLSWTIPKVVGDLHMKRFNPSSLHSDRAVQARQILVGKAMNRQTVTYLGLSNLMYRKDAAGVLDKILGHIAYFC
jgi:hypothetical protein